MAGKTGFTKLRSLPVLARVGAQRALTADSIACTRGSYRRANAVRETYRLSVLSPRHGAAGRGGEKQPEK